MLGMFLFYTAYFGTSVSTSSLLIAADNGILLLLAFHAFNYVVLFARMVQKGELFGFAVAAHPSTFTNYVGLFTIWSLFYLLTCGAPMLIAAVQTEVGTGIFSSLIVWSSLSNGVIVFVGLGALENHPYLNMTNGMAAQ
jgi:hypothetical protein